MPDTTLDVYRRWAPAGVPVFRGAVLPFRLEVVLGKDSQSALWWLKVDLPHLPAAAISPDEANALCRAKAVEELMADGWNLGPLVASGEYLLRNFKRPDNGAIWGANLDDALAESLRKVNAKPPLERNTPNAD